MASPSRFPNGVGNSTPASAMGMLGMPDPSKFHAFWDDFDNFTAADWVVTEIDTDGDAGVANTTTTGDGGVLTVNVEADELDSTFLQWSGNTNAAVVENWTFESGKKMFFKARWKVSDATDTGVVMGLQITDTAPIAVTDGVFFYKADTSTTCNLIVETSSTETSTTAATIADDTYIVTAFYYDGKSKVEAYVNDALVGTSATDNLPSTELTISFGCINGVEGVEAMNVDYIFVAKER